MNNSFTKLPKYEGLPGGKLWATHGQMRYIDPWGKPITVPDKFVTDFASIPNLSQIGLVFFIIFGTLAQFFNPWLFLTLTLFPAWVIWIAEDFLHEGTWDAQSCLHDYMYATRCRTFWQSNWILLVSMNATGAEKTPTWKRWVIFAGVTVGGYFAWVDDAKKRKDAKLS